MRLILIYAIESIGLFLLALSLEQYYGVCKMNKRLKKKKQKEKDLFVSSYKEYKQFERRYYEYYIQSKKYMELRHPEARKYIDGDFDF